MNAKQKAIAYLDTFNDDDYGFMDKVGTGLAKTGSVIASGAKKVGAGVGKTLSSTPRAMVTGAVIGAGVNGLRGKSVAKGAVGGAAVGAAARQVNKMFSNKNKTMNKERNFSEAELADQFADFYTEREETYGDNLETAYADFIAFSNGEVSEENTYSQEDLENDFADFYAETEDIYGDNMDEAYADFLELNSEDIYDDEEEYDEDEEFDFDEDEDEYDEDEDEDYDDEDEEDEDEDLESDEDEDYDEEDEYDEDEDDEDLEDEDEDELYSDFAAFYAETEDIYADDVDTAYADFMEFQEEDEFSLKSGLANLGKRVKSGIQKGNAKFDKWIDRTHGKMKKAGISSPYGSQQAFSDEDNSEMDAFSDGFAKFYAENEDVYGESDEDLEEAYDDYADIVAENELESMYSAEDEAEDNEYSFGSKAKDIYGKAKGGVVKGFGKAKAAATGKTAKSMAIGAGVGAAAGLAGGLIAGSVGAKARERKALKAKAKAGTLTASEQAKYSQLKADRRKTIAKVAGAGALVGAGAGLASHKSGLNAKVANAATSGMKRAKREGRKGEILKSGKFKTFMNQAKAFKGGAKDSLKRDSNNSAEDAKVEETVVETPVVTAPAEKTFSAIDLIGNPGSKDTAFSALPVKDIITKDAGSPDSMVMSILRK